MTKPIIAITMGDPVGVGPEVIVKGLLDPSLHALCSPFVIGHLEWLSKAASLFAPSLSIRPIEAVSEARFEPGVLDLLPVSSTSCTGWRYGESNPYASQVAVDALHEAVRLAQAGAIDAMVTASINKEAMNKIRFAYPGHTEFLAERAGVKRFGMMMVGGDPKDKEPLKIVLATIHVALKDMIGMIRKELILEKIRLTHESLTSDFGLSFGRIAVAALNPHAGEGGLFGNEEAMEVQPAILAAQKEGIFVEGPYPADTLFYRLRQGQFDAVVALYHDQALIPIKLLGFGCAVNVTIGLPFIRTSVDHGTAYDIAGKGIAEPGSLVAAISLAARMASCRKKLSQ